MKMKKNLIILIVAVFMGGVFYVAPAFTQSDVAFADDLVKYKVTFHVRGGRDQSDPAFKTQYVVSGDYATRPTKDPVKARRTFAFWATPTEDFEFVFTERPITENTYLQARYWMSFNLSTYDVVKDEENTGSGGTVAMNGGNPTAGSDDPVRVLDHNNATFTAIPKEGYVFRGWWINGEKYSEEKTITLQPGTKAFGADCKVQARFDYWDVKFEMNGGKPQEKTQKVSDGGKATKPASDPTKEDFNFSGWYEDAELTKPFDFDGTNITEDTTIYAKWGCNIVASMRVEGEGSNYGQVRVNDQPWSTTSSSEVVDIGDEVTLTAEPLSGYKFDHWKKALDEEVSRDPIYKFDADGWAVYVAVFKPAWHVTYDANGGTTTNEDRYVDYGSTITLPGRETFSRPGYRCVPEYNIKTGDEVKSESAGEPITITGDTIIQAQWLESEYTVDVEIAEDCEGQGKIGIDTPVASDTEITGRSLKAGTAHVICASPADEYAFDYWDYKIIAGPREGETGTSDEEELTIDAGTYSDEDRIEFTAHFTEGVKHSISVTPPENGAIDVDEEEAYKNKLIEITLGPDVYYRLKGDSLKVIGERGQEYGVRGAGNKRTFRMPDENVTVSCEFELIPITSIEPIDPQTIDEGDDVVVPVTIDPDTADPRVTWTSSDESIATVTGSLNEVTVEGKKAGEVTVTGVSYIDPTKTVSFDVTVVHRHSFTHVPPKEATCTETGISREYWTCDRGDNACGKSYIDSKGKEEIDPSTLTIPALGHDYSSEVPGTAKEATCMEPGKEADMDCTRCDSTQTGKEIPPLGHKWDAGKVTKKPTATATGIKTFTCTRCKATRTEVIPKLNKKVLVAKGIASGSKAVNISWNNVSADRYVIYLSKCNVGKKKYKYKKVKTVSGKTLKWKKTKLAKKTSYRFYVVAQKKSGGSYKNISKSLAGHFITGNVRGKYTTPKKLTINKTAVTLKKGKSFTIKGKVTKVKAGKKLETSHAKTFRYISNNPSIASVSAKGKITAKGKGTCTIYVQTINGIWKTIKVKVR